MTQRIDLKLAFVDDRKWYSPYLSKSLSKLLPNLICYIYLPKWDKTKPLSRDLPSVVEKAKSHYSKVWSPYFYPFQIFKKAVSDKVNLVHVQWELNSFGSFYASSLLPLLLFLLWLSRIKSVVTVHSVIPRASFDLKLPGFTLRAGVNLFVKLFFILLYKMVVILSNAIIVHGESSKKSLYLDYKLKPEKIFVIPYGIASEVRDACSSSKFDAILSGEQEIILAAGTISPRKGFDILIRAFSKLSLKHPSLVLVIAGKVPSYYEHYYSYLVKLSSKLIKQNRIIFLGEFKQPDIHGLLEKSEIVIFPYIYNFGASSILTFALQHRKIIVISALSFATDLLTDGENALLVSPGNPSSLAKAIEHAMCDDHLRRNVKIGIDELLQRSSWDFSANETLKVYNTILLGASELSAT